MRSRPFGASELALLRDLTAAGDPAWDIGEILSRPPAAVREKMAELGIRPKDGRMRVLVGEPQQ